MVYITKQKSVSFVWWSQVKLVFFFLTSITHSRVIKKNEWIFCAVESKKQETQERERERERERESLFGSSPSLPLLAHPLQNRPIFFFFFFFEHFRVLKQKGFGGFFGQRRDRVEECAFFFDATLRPHFLRETFSFFFFFFFFLCGRERFSSLFFFSLRTPIGAQRCVRISLSLSLSLSLCSTHGERERERERETKGEKVISNNEK